MLFNGISIEEKRSVERPLEEGNPENSLKSFPNPFSESAQIQFTVAKEGRTKLSVYDMAGVRVVIFFDDDAQPGQVYEFSLKGKGLKPGIYYSKLITDQGEVCSHKLIYQN